MGESSQNGLKNAEGKGEIARYEQFLLFPTVFSKDLYCRHVKARLKLNDVSRGGLEPPHASYLTSIIKTG